VNETTVLNKAAPRGFTLTSNSVPLAAGVGDSVLYGGQSSTGTVSSSTLIFDDGNWENLTLFQQGPGPPALTQANLAYDARDGYVVLFGGRESSGALFGGTWAYRNINGYYDWFNLTGAVAPPPEAGGAMAYDPSSQEVVLADPASPSTWFFQGGNWTSQLLDPAPVDRSGTTMVTDSSVGDAVLLGGRPEAPGSAPPTTSRRGESSWSAARPAAPRRPGPTRPPAGPSTKTARRPLPPDATPRSSTPPAVEPSCAAAPTFRGPMS